MKVSPAIKISFGLVLLTISILLIGDLIGILPDENKGSLENRKRFSESLSVQISMAASRNEFELIRATLASVVERNNEILSAAMRTKGGKLVAVAGDHKKHWAQVVLEKSTSTHVQVPVMRGKIHWGTVEVSFVPLPQQSLWQSLGASLGRLLLFVALCGFLLYLLFIKKTLRELDPRSVIPERIKSAFNALAEGLVILDEKEQIILANSSFAEKVESTSEALIGKKASEINWLHESSSKGQVSYPWNSSLNEQQRKTGIPLKFRCKDKSCRTFTVNTTPILDGKGNSRGALATFDDLTDLEKKHDELNSTIKQLRRSEEKLRDKTLELEYLATRDPLTGCLNRRALFDKLEMLFLEASESGRGLVCIMVDIDHFKSINDRYGHTTGDKVIKTVAELLRADSRPNDLVGRYGGEEFCLVLPEATLDHGIDVAERLRKCINDGSTIRFATAVRVTASFGVAELDDQVIEVTDLVGRADKALYAAKEAGRNRVIHWNDPRVSDGNPTRADNAEISLDDSIPAASATIPLKNRSTRTPEQPAPSDDLRRLQQHIEELEAELEYNRRELKNHAGMDRLTGLPGRVLFFDRIHQALARSRRFDQIVAVISFDIDAFKRINDALGSIVGDKVLQQLARRLTDTLRNTDTVAVIGNDNGSSTVSRLGSDEFGILVTDLPNVESVTWVAKRIIDRASQRLDIDGHEIFATCSIGVSLYPHDADNPEKLFQHASSARINAKQQLGRNNLQFFSKDTNTHSYKQLWLEGQIHNALENDEFSVHYQPKIDLETGAITGMEALIRWKHPRVGMIRPNEFIPVAEHANLINSVGEWILRTACRQKRIWIDEGFPSVRVAVNLSAIQLRQDDFADVVFSILDETGLKPEHLELEITESSLMGNLDTAARIMERLHDSGINFSIDDFGTGYSSLSYLRNLPVDNVKIDRSFLSSTTPSRQDQLIISAIIAMAHSMELRVVAEGVETEAQRRFLTGLGCDEIQGYLFSKPVPAEQAISLLSTRNRSTTDTAA